MVFDHLKKNGFEVTPINPNTTEIDGVACYSDVTSLPADVENLLVVTPKSQTTEIIKQAKEKGIKRVFIQQMSDNPEALNIAMEGGMELISKKCIFMFTEPVTGVHKFHRFFMKMFGKLYN